MNQLQSMTRGYMDCTGSTPVFTPSGLSQSWTLDATGNWTSVTTNGTTQDETANAANQITGISGGSVTPVYDNAGNMTLTPQPTDSTAGYNLVYDAWNRLVAVTTGSGGSQTMVAQYEYDGLNRRIVENTYSGGTLSQTTHYYLSSSDQVLEERPGNSTSANQQYVWGLRYVNDLVLRDDASCGGNLGIAGSGLGERLYAIQDANWNVVAIANTSGVVVERYTYTAYGQVEFRNANFSKTDGGLGDVSNYGWTTLFAGMDLGSVTGEYYDRARWYDPALGVFDTTDPTGYMGGMDLYEYCGDAPFGRTDSTGLFDVGCNCEGKWIDIPIRLGYVKGTSWVRWEGMKKDLDDANKIWAQCCIRFDLVNSNEPIIISQNIGPNGYLMIDVNAGAISETPFHVNNPTSINVFYVPGFVANYGSPDLGNAIGVSQAGSSNEYLTYTWTQFHQLAHEIGHTLLGPGHPDDNYNNSLEDPYTKRLMCKNASWQTDTELKSDECDTARQKAEELNQRFKNNAAAAK